VRQLLCFSSTLPVSREALDVAHKLALAFTGPAFAGDVTTAKTQADCEKAGGMWDATTKVCSEKKM
jgi:hypothetical protein